MREREAGILEEFCSLLAEKCLSCFVFPQLAPMMGLVIHSRCHRPQYCFFANASES